MEAPTENYSQASPTGPVPVHPRRPSRTLLFNSAHLFRSNKRSVRRGAPKPCHPSGFFPIAILGRRLFKASGG